jgi:hypothetical protein
MSVHARTKARTGPGVKPLKYLRLDSVSGWLSQRRLTQESFDDLERQAAIIVAGFARIELLAAEDSNIQST